MSKVVTLPLLVVSMLMSACTRNDAPVRVGAVPPATLAQLLADQLPALRNGVSLGEWKRLQPRDSIGLYTPTGAERINENWCARAATTVQLDSIHVVTRTAYFYPPRTPEPPVLPDESSPDRCRLGFLWIETRVADSANAAVLVGESRETLSRTLGPAHVDARVHWWAVSSWRNTAFWRQDELTAVTALTGEPTWAELAAPTGGTRVLIAAAGPASDIDLEWTDPTLPPLWTEQLQHDAARLQQAIELTGAAAELERPLLSFVRALDPATLYNRLLTIAERHTFVDAVDRWLYGTAQLPPERRAAALLAADIFVQRFQSHAGLGEADRAALRQRLQAHGADFKHGPLGDYHVYTRSWLYEARRLDPDGPAGELAFLALMETGFETSGTCGDSGEHFGFRDVIEQGEAFLRTRPDSPIAADVHFLVAQGYADIVTLAHGGGQSYVAPDPYVAEAPSARLKAIEHYRAAFTRAPVSYRARESWPTAWRLLAGLTPTRTFFYCIYD